MSIAEDGSTRLIGLTDKYYGILSACCVVLPHEMQCPLSGVRLWIRRHNVPVTYRHGYACKKNVEVCQHTVSEVVLGQGREYTQDMHIMALMPWTTLLARGWPTGFEGFMFSSSTVDTRLTILRRVNRGRGWAVLAGSAERRAGEESGESKSTLV